MTCLHRVSQVFVAKYQYDPEQFSPNENPDQELALNIGDYIFVYGDMDEVREYYNSILFNRHPFFFGHLAFPKFVYNNLKI